MPNFKRGWFNWTLDWKKNSRPLLLSWNLCIGICTIFHSAILNLIAVIILPGSILLVWGFFKLDFKMRELNRLDNIEVMLSSIASQVTYIRHALVDFSFNWVVFSFNWVTLNFEKKYFAAPDSINWFRNSVRTQLCHLWNGSEAESVSRREISVRLFYIGICVFNTSAVIVIASRSINWFFNHNSTLRSDLARPNSEIASGF